MARITILSLQIALAEQAEQLRAARQRVGELEVNLEIANKRIARGHELVRELKAAALKVAEPRVIVRKMVKPVAGPVVTRFYRGGKLIEKTRVGNTATEREVV